MVKSSLRYLGGLALLMLLTMATANADTAAPGVSTNENNFLGAVAQGQYETMLSPDSAVSGILQLGNRNLRANGTVGFKIDNSDAQWLKFTGEFLAQDIDYQFFSGIQREWVEQGAVGVGYQYNLNNPIFKNIDVSTYYSHAPSHNLGTVSGSYVQADGTLANYTDARRIAGSNAEGAQAGFTADLWPGADLALAANYDNVVYDMRYQSDVAARGLGASATFDQIIDSRIKFNATASVRAAFNDYEAGFSFLQPTHVGTFEWTVYGDQTVGKKSLPDISLVGVKVNYAIGAPKKYTYTPANDTLEQWVAKPAVYMPQVLAIADERVSQTCTAANSPSFQGTFPSPLFAVIEGGGVFIVGASDIGALSSYFTSNSALNFSIVKVRNSPLNASASILGDGSLQFAQGASSGSTDLGGYVIRATNAQGCSAQTNQFQVEVAL